MVTRNQSNYYWLAASTSEEENNYILRYITLSLPIKYLQNAPKAHLSFFCESAPLSGLDLMVSCVNWSGNKLKWLLNVRNGLSVV